MCRIRAGGGARSGSTGGNGGRPVRRACVFPERGQAYSYYNDRFDLHDGDLVYVSGKLARQRGQVVAVDYNFRIRLADYERVISAADRNVRGTFYALGAHLVTLEPNVLPYAQVRSWFFRRKRTGNTPSGTAPGRCMRSSSCPSRPASPKKATHTTWKTGRSTCLWTARPAAPS